MKTLRYRIRRQYHRIALLPVLHAIDFAAFMKEPSPVSLNLNYAVYNTFFTYIPFTAPIALHLLFSLTSLGRAVSFLPLFTSFLLIIIVAVRTRNITRVYTISRYRALLGPEREERLLRFYKRFKWVQRTFMILGMLTFLLRIYIFVWPLYKKWH